MVGADGERPESRRRGGRNALSPSQQNLVGLCATLDIATTGFGFADNEQYLRHQHFWAKDYTTKPPLPTPGGIPYWLIGDEAQKSPIQLVVDAISALVPGATGRSGYDLIQFLRAATVDGVPLYEWGFWTLLKSKLSVDAYHLVQDASGYFSIYGNWSAYGAFLEFLRNYAHNDYQKVIGGYQQVPLTLIERFRQLGGGAQVNTRLCDIQPDSVDGEAVIRLEFMLSSGTTRLTQHARVT